MIGSTGELMVGAVSCDGYIRNLSVTGNVQSNATWDIEYSTDGVVLVAVDGNIESVLDINETEYDTFAQTGEHRFQIYPSRIEIKNYNDLHGDFYGRNAYLDWTPSSSIDCVGYKIYQDSVLIDTVSTINVKEELCKLPTTGTGTGRITISGYYTGEDINTQYVITILSNNRWSENILNNTYVIRKDGHFNINDGIVAKFEDDKEDYVVGDTYNIIVGPETEYESDELDEGTYTFEIKPYDSAGNLGTAISKTVKIVHRPRGITNLEVEYDGANITLIPTLPDDDTIQHYKVYTNYLQSFNVLGQYVDEDSNYFSLVEGDYSGNYGYGFSETSGYAFNPPVSGPWKFYVRGVNEDGIESDSIILATVDTFELPTNINLNIPENIEIFPYAGGGVTLTWNYDWKSGEDLIRFYFYTSDTENGILDNLGNDISDSSIVVSANYEVVSYSQVFNTDYTLEGPTRYFAIRASNGTYKTTNFDFVYCTVDKTAPETPSLLYGVGN